MSAITPVEAEEKMTNYPPLTSPKLNSGRFGGNKLMPYTAVQLKSAVSKLWVL